MRFEILRTTNASQPYYWRIVAANNEILAHSENYTTKAGCENAIGVVRAGAAGAVVNDKT